MKNNIKLEPFENIDFDLLSQYLPDEKEISKYLRTWLVK